MLWLDPCHDTALSWLEYFSFHISVELLFTTRPSNVLQLPVFPHHGLQNAVGADVNVSLWSSRPVPAHRKITLQCLSKTAVLELGLRMRLQDWRGNDLTGNGSPNLSPACKLRRKLAPASRGQGPNFACRLHSPGARKFQPHAMLFFVSCVYLLS